MIWWIALTLVVAGLLIKAGIFNLRRPISRQDRKRKLATNAVMWVFWWLFWQSGVFPGYWLACWALLIAMFSVNRVLRPTEPDYVDAALAEFEGYRQQRVAEEKRFAARQAK